jgi:hypothetical protein
MLVQPSHQPDHQGHEQASEKQRQPCLFVWIQFSLHSKESILLESERDSGFTTATRVLITRVPPGQLNYFPPGYEQREVLGQFPELAGRDRLKGAFR